ncbi:RHS repeat-associated core domain-containing protein [Hyella patelloides]|nr:RHS repeat-associated core domain-containing protein [Hyella patelloides]
MVTELILVIVLGYYDSMTGRFINEDLIGMNSGDTNLYAYVGNSPTLYTVV